MVINCNINEVLKIAIVSNNVETNILYTIKIHQIKKIGKNNVIKFIILCM